MCVKRNLHIPARLISYHQIDLRA